MLNIKKEQQAHSVECPGLQWDIAECATLRAHDTAADELADAIRFSMLS